MGKLFQFNRILYCMIDYHVHSTYSIDGISPPYLYVEPAQQYGIKEIGFAEHVDLDPHVWGYRFLQYSEYSTSVEELKKSAPIQIRCGLEISYQAHLEDCIKDFLSIVQCDFVIGSVHEVHRKTMDHTFLEQYTPSDYFEAVKRLAISGTCDIVGHLEYFKRWGGTYSSATFKKEISAVLQSMIDNDLVLEVNTSGLHHSACDTYPSLQVVQWYKELGGELISLGSDAHRAQDIGFQFPSVIRKLTSKGIDRIATFNKRVLQLTEL